MKINNLLFAENKKRMDEVESMGFEVAGLLADVNEFPLRVLNYEKKFTDDKYNLISQGLKKLQKLYSDAIVQYGFEPFLKYLKSDSSRILFFSERNDKISLRNLVNQVVIELLSGCYLKVDDYILPSRRPKVFEAIKGINNDADNLVQVNKEFELHKDGIFYDKKHLIYYHSFLRRFFTSNFTDTTMILSKLAKRDDLDIRIGIDPYRLASPRHYRGDIIEADFWYGPKFSETKLNDRNYVGKVVYGRSEQPKLDIWPIRKTDFYISNRKDGTKQIEIEEVNPAQGITYSKKFILQKYIHLIWDSEKKKFMHLDTAVKIYKRDNHSARESTHWKDKGARNRLEKPRKVKLYRIDGGLNIDETMVLVGDFFRYNELVKEFFEGR